MASVLPNPAHATDAPDTITMYGADWCGDCLRAKAFFAENDVAYDFVDLVEHEAGTPIVLARNDGVQKIPVIIYPDNSHLTEPTNDQLAAKLSEMQEGAGEEDAEYSIVENRDEGRFELHRQGEVLSIATFSERSGGVVVIPHVETDPQHRGLGNADRLMDGLLNVLRDTERTVFPACPFAAQFIDEHPEHQDLLA